MRFLFCLPVYNEIESIQFVVAKVQAFGYDLLITDGGSTDGTRAAIADMGIPCIDRPGKGKGVGLRLALEFAAENGYTHMGYLDCDMTYPVDKFNHLLSHSDADMVVGVRDFSALSLVRRLVNIFFRILINFRFKASFTDVLSGMRLLKVSKFHKALQGDFFEIEPEMNMLAAEKQYQVVEVPIPYLSRAGESKIGARAFFQILTAILFYPRR
jgi:glycosyltransferase involved in cell wall biosynthesis